MDIFGNSENLQGDKASRKVNRSAELNFSYGVGDDDMELIIDNNFKKSFLVLYGISTLIFIWIIVCLFLSQVVYSSDSEKLAEGNKIRPRIVPAMRGIISDNEGAWLARNVPSFDLALYPSDLPKEKDLRENIYQKLSDLINISTDELREKSEINGLLSLDLIVLKPNLTTEEALILEQKIAGLNGVFINKRASREYKELSGVAHILGYTGKISKEDLREYPEYYFSDWAGKNGIEAEYEKYLHGDNGVEYIEVDSKGNIERVMADDKNREPVSGNSVTLYLDSGLQEVSHRALIEALEEAKKAGAEDANSGAVIAINPQNGGILSMVSLPFYDNNLFANSISAEDYQMLLNDEEKPMFNRATGGIYPPGSIIKIVMAAAGLSEGNINLNTAFDTPEAIEIGEWRYPDWKDHGYTDIKKAIAESNNIFFYSIGGGYENIKGIGIEAMNKWWQNFGLGEKTGIDLSGESAGLLPDDDWKRAQFDEPWYLGDTYLASVGQGFLLVTPLQMLRATATIANDGKMLQPQIVEKISDSEGNIVKEFGPIVQKDQVAEPWVIETIQQGMRKTVTEGSAKNLQDLPVSVAGKTGTAQFFSNQKTHAWFECYAPYENPEIAIIVLVEGGGGGHEIAAPVAKKMLNYYYTR